MLRDLRLLLSIPNLRKYAMSAPVMFCVPLVIGVFVFEWLIMLVALLSIVRYFRPNTPVEHDLMPTGTLGLPASGHELRRLAGSLPGCVIVAALIFINRNKYSLWFMAVLLCLAYVGQAPLHAWEAAMLYAAPLCVAYIYPVCNPAESRDGLLRNGFRDMLVSVWKVECPEATWLICIIAAAFAATSIRVAYTIGKYGGGSVPEILMFMATTSIYVVAAMLWFFVRYSSGARERTPLVRLVNIGGFAISIGLLAYTIIALVQFARA